jgi:hypothetical protein
VSLFSDRDVDADPRRSANGPSIVAGPIAMRRWRTLNGLLPAATISLAVAAPALAVPAGSEYIPKVPKAAGEEILRGTQGPGGTILSPEVRGADADETSDSGGDEDSREEDSNATGAAETATGAAGTTPGAADTLLDPVVLLLIAGVAAAALSMTLRQRHSVPEDDGGAASDPGSTPPTPDGEIVDREPRS